MIHAPVLQMPDFEDTFMVETDALGLGIGAVLQQIGHPIAFMSKNLALKHHTFLKYLMDQRFTTPAHMKWLPKVMGFDFEVIYKKGSENVARNALSKLPNTGEQLQLTVDKDSVKHYVWSSQQLLRKGKLVISDDQQLRQEFFKFFHEGSQGLLQPLPIPAHVWTNISMYFVDGLPMSKGISVLLVVVDRLSKYNHFIPLTYPYTALTLAQAFLDNVYKLLQVSVDMSTAYHTQADGQTKVVKKYVECYLRFMVDDRPKEWVQWIPLAEYWSLAVRKDVVQLFKFHLQRARDRMKSMADKKRTERVFGIDYLWQRIGQVAYKLDKSGFNLKGPYAILDRRIAKKGNATTFYVLVQWINERVDDVTWELYDDTAARFPDFDLNA
ncbi:retrotransposon-related protein [Tanacetum coccineum]